ncbi:MAG: HAD family hydrolase [Anaerolineae bacterium]
MTSNIRAIIFDFGGVLIGWEPHRVYRRFFDDPDETAAFLAEIGFAEWNAKQDAGRPFAEGVAELSARFPQHAHLIRAYHEHWEDSITGPIPGSVELVRALKRRGIAVYGLSNWSAETFPLVQEKYEVFGLLDGYIISGNVGLAKPDPAIFQILLEGVGRPASECLLIDDAPTNIETARQLGFETILFRSPGALRIELLRLGLLDS